MQTTPVKKRKRNNDYEWRKKYEKTINGFLVRVYRNMKSRVTGVQKQYAHLYLGLPILPKEEFYVWAKACPIFNQLYHEWVAADYTRTLTPSVDRINSSLGYIHPNIRWLTSSENSRLASCQQKQS